MDFDIVRVIRTPHSERFLLRASGTDFAAVDLHYLAGNRVDATLVLLEGGRVTESQIPELLKKLDEVLLPDVSLEEHNLLFTVVVGRVMGAYAPQAQADGAPKE